MAPASATTPDRRNRGRGPERTATLTLDAPGTLHALVFDQGDVDVDIHVLRASSGECLARNDKEAVVDLAAGTYTLVYDSYAGAAQAGAFQTMIYVE